MSNYTACCTSFRSRNRDACTGWRQKKARSYTRWALIVTSLKENLEHLLR